MTVPISNRKKPEMTVFISDAKPQKTRNDSSYQFYDKKHDLETMLLNHILLRLRNVIITPHSAFNTREAVERILSTTVGNIASFTRGESENVIPDERM